MPSSSNNQEIRLSSLPSKFITHLSVLSIHSSVLFSLASCALCKMQVELFTQIMKTFFICIYYPPSLSLQVEKPCLTRRYGCLMLLLLCTHFPLLSQVFTWFTNSVFSIFDCHLSLSLRLQVFQSFIFFFLLPFFSFFLFVLFPLPPWSFGFFSFFLWLFVRKTPNRNSALCK